MRFAYAELPYVLLLLAGVTFATSCQGRDARPAAAESRSGTGAALPATPSSAPTRLAAGTPAGGLRAWIGDVRRGLDGVAATAAVDPERASRTALDLYLTRQEYIEMYWGTAGRLSRGAELGPAVKEAETRFHLLLSRFKKSAGAVLFGAFTYIGNGPNFMVKSIAEATGAKTPTFVGYVVKYSLPVLAPTYLVIWFIFIRGH